MNIHIRQEITTDHPIVNQIVKSAFESLGISDQTEHLLVQRLRQSKSFIPELSLVATVNNQLVGHIILTPIKIKNEKASFNSLALAPVSVMPNMQTKGIGSALIRESHQVAKDLGYNSVILIGHEDYYPRFGYSQAQAFGIRFPFDVPPQNGFAIELSENSLQNVSGEVIYPQCFFE